MHKNKTQLSGKVISIKESHALPNSSFLEFMVEVPRKSEASDIVPFIISAKLLHNNEIAVGDYVQSIGEIRTINKNIDNKNRLLVFNFVHEIKGITEKEHSNIFDKNIVELQGYVVKKPVYRETTKGRRVADLLVAHNRSFAKESYIPSIAWGSDASFAKNISISEVVSIKGRFQSRNYYTSTGESKVAYELSISSNALAILE